MKALIDTSKTETFQILKYLSVQIPKPTNTQIPNIIKYSMLQKLKFLG